MIIVVQKHKGTINSLKQLLGVMELSMENFFWTTDYHRALEKVRELKDSGQRTIVVSSEFFWGSLSGETLAEAVDAIDPSAWFFIYSCLKPTRTQHIDGFIYKFDNESLAQVKQFMATDFSKFESLEALYQQLPWIKPAWLREA